MPPRPRPRRRSCLVALVLLVPVLTACVSDGSDDSDSSASEVRIAEIRAARAVVEDPASALAEATASVAEAVETLRSDPPVRPDARLDAATTIRQDHIPVLDDALAQADEVEIEGSSPDVTSARAVWEDLVERGRAVRAAAIEELEAIERAANLDVALADLAKQWDEPGSRSQQITRFIELQEEAERLAESIDAEDVGACLTTFERRRDAAQVVAERTDELRVLVERYRGDEFDELRSEYRQDPYGLGAALTEQDAEEIDCWREVSPLVAAREAVMAALDRLEAALNPSDL